MRFSDHSKERIDMRLRSQLGLSNDKIHKLKVKMLKAGLRYPWKYQAVRIEKLDKKVQLDRKYESSYGWGDELWAVIKNNVVVTAMFRNSNKPKSPDYFDNDVDLVWSLV